MNDLRSLERSVTRTFYYGDTNMAKQLQEFTSGKAESVAFKAFNPYRGLIPRPLGRKTGGAGDLFPRIRKDFKEKS
jgi:hypothetical protein